jgi:hypothetical protein
MPVEEFLRKRDSIIENLRRSENQDNFFFYQKGTKFNVHITDVKIVEEKKPLLTEIQFEGKDYFGAWKALGSIMSKKN